MSTTHAARHTGRSLDHPTPVPRSVSVSFLFWLGAIAAALLEMVEGVREALVDATMSGPALAINLAVRLTIFAVAVFVMVRMRAGRWWARIGLAVGLGVFGTASLVYGPIGWLLDGHSVGALLASADAAFVYSAVARVLHLAGVAGGVVFMFLPSANRYFAETRRRIR